MYSLLRSLLAQERCRWYPGYCFTKRYWYLMWTSIIYLCIFYQTVWSVTIMEWLTLIFQFYYKSLLKATTGGGAVMLISSKLTSLVSLDQSQLKPIGRYCGSLLKLAQGGKWASLAYYCNLRRPPAHIPLGLWLDCSNDTRFVSLVEMSFTEPPWWP